MSNPGEEVIDEAHEHSTHLFWVPRPPLGTTELQPCWRTQLLCPHAPFLFGFRPSLASLSPLGAMVQPTQYSPGPKGVYSLNIACWRDQAVEKALSKAWLHEVITRLFNFGVSEPQFPYPWEEGVETYESEVTTCVPVPTLTWPTHSQNLASLLGHRLLRPSDPPKEALIHGKLYWKPNCPFTAGVQIEHPGNSREGHICARRLEQHSGPQPWLA